MQRIHFASQAFGLCAAEGEGSDISSRAGGGALGVILFYWVLPGLNVSLCCWYKAQSACLLAHSFFYFVPFFRILTSLLCTGSCACCYCYEW